MTFSEAAASTMHQWQDWSPFGSNRWRRYCHFYCCVEVRESAPGIASERPVTLPRLVYARLMHLAYAGANLLAEPNGQTDVEPFAENEAWLDQIDKEAGQ